jgi:hypothetical protein
LIFTAFMIEKRDRQRGSAIAKILLGFSALFVPYLLFNLALSGHPLPNTFYAKQAEYQSAWLALGLAYRLNNYLMPILASPFIALLPGAILWIMKRIRAWDWAVIASLLWFVGYIGLYFLILPAYQHGRYIIPAFPIMYLWGILGLVGYVTSPNSNRRVALVWTSLTGLLCLLFTVVAAQQNAADVAWIEKQMVGTAKWVRQNIPPDALLAVHDIGAVGYFDQHQIIDLAGLVSPDVVPFISDQDRISTYLHQRGAAYLVTLPDFYPKLVSGLQQVYPPDVACNSADVQATMCVFRWK